LPTPVLKEDDNSCKAIACLRVILYGLQARQHAAELDALVGKLINAFLETRWIWPRQFAQMTAYAFILSDPRVKTLDKVALQALSRELQSKLFGASGGGEVALILFEGEEPEVHRFAALEPEEVRRLTNGEGGVSPPFEGQLSHVTPHGAKVIDPTPRIVSYSTPKFERNYEPLYRALYFAPSRRFFANIALCKPLGAVGLCDRLAGAHVLPGVATEEFDEGCVESALEALRQAPVQGQLFVPLNFSSLIRPASRLAYGEFLSRLPIGHRDKLSAAVYETPRDPSFFALNQISKYLAGHFGQFNLVVSDPGFEIEKLPQGLVASVGLVLPEADAPSRLASIRRFMQNREIYKRKQVWPGVLGVATRGELDLCVELRTPAISGPAVSQLTPGPIGAVQWEPSGAPYRLRRPTPSLRPKPKPE
jgi:hypothetical protein